MTDDAAVARARAAVLGHFRWIDGHADTWSVLRSGDGLQAVVAGLAALVEPFRPDVVVGIESRGFVIAPAVANALGVGFAPVRKDGAVFPGPREELLTGRDYRGRRRTLSARRDLLGAGSRVVLVDDWIETGSQAMTAAELVETCGSEVVAVVVIVDEASASARDRLSALSAVLRASELPPWDGADPSVVDTRASGITAAAGASATSEASRTFETSGAAGASELPGAAGVDPDDDVPGGPGWIIRGGDLRPVVVDLAAFRTGLHGDPLAHCLELLWTGDPAAALAALAPFDRTARVRALRADCLRDLGDVRAAVREYDVLVRETAGTSREAVMRQHRGKALLAAGDPALAIVDFTLAVELRRSGDPVLLASARQGLSVAVRRARSAATD